jgi:hypothetical protein
MSCRTTGRTAFVASLRYVPSGGLHACGAMPLRMVADILVIGEKMTLILITI